jgi:hypothetical protein
MKSQGNPYLRSSICPTACYCVPWRTGTHWGRHCQDFRNPHCSHLLGMKHFGPYSACFPIPAFDPLADSTTEGMAPFSEGHCQESRYLGNPMPWTCAPFQQVTNGFLHKIWMAGPTLWTQSLSKTNYKFLNSLPFPLLKNWSQIHVCTHTHSHINIYTHIYKYKHIHIYT